LTAPATAPESLELPQGAWKWSIVSPVPRQNLVRLQNEWLGANLDSDFSDMIPAMIASLGHFLSWMASAFTVPTLTFGVLHCFFVISHDRRKILHFNMTRNSDALRVAQQLREAWAY
jgi:hypothetical protein